jgi:hypothetical protein
VAAAAVKIMVVGMLSLPLGRGVSAAGAIVNDVLLYSHDAAGMRHH